MATPAWHKPVVALILTWVLGLGLFLAWRDSATTDEDIHVASAYLAITRGEFRFDPEHPFLFKHLTALPLLALNLNMPGNDQELWSAGQKTVYDSWRESRSWADQWFFTSGNNGDLMIWLARIPGVVSMVLLCALVYALGKRWFSPAIGFYALIFTAFNPTIIGHGHLTNTDIPAALAFLGTIWGLYYYFQKPNYKTAALAGLLFAIAQATKYSMVVLAPIAAVWLLYVIYKKGLKKETFGHIGLFLLLFIVVIWTVYFFPIKLWNGSLFTIYGSTLLPDNIPISQDLFDKILYFRYILPLDYLKGLSLVLVGSHLGRLSYFMGEFRWGTWQYFPLLFVFKTQLAGLLVLVCGLALFLTQPVKRMIKAEPITLLLIISAGIFIFFSLINKLNLGIRHILPLLPIVSLAMAASLDRIVARTKKAWLAPGFLAAYCLPIFIFFPNYIGYANAIVLPREKTYTYFNDSNIDWGQQAKDIVKTVNERYPNDRIYQNFFWNPYILSYYGLQSEGFDYKNPPTDGVIILTATQLTFPEYVRFRTETPDYVIANHTFFYRLNK